MSEEVKEMKYNPIKIDTESFVISLDEDFVPSIQLISPEASELYGNDNGKLTAGCVAEMAHELFYAKKSLEESLQENEKLVQTVEHLEDELHKSVADCEMLRDELDKY